MLGFQNFTGFKKQIWSNEKLKGGNKNTSRVESRNPFLRRAFVVIETKNLMADVYGEMDVNGIRMHLCRKHLHSSTRHRTPQGDVNRQTQQGKGSASLSFTNKIFKNPGVRMRRRWCNN